jgi:DNA-binding CsgD family transcriptional regulator
MRTRNQLSRALALVTAQLAIQLVCLVFILSDMLSSLIGFRSPAISWEVREYLEIGAAVGLTGGIVLGAMALRRALKARHVAEQRLHQAQAAFQDLLDERFAQWNLTPAERDVARFIIQGQSTGDVALLRQTSEGTVKAQTYAIYRKAGVTGRTQLVSLFIEELMDIRSVAAQHAPDVSRAAE